MQHSIGQWIVWVAVSVGQFGVVTRMVFSGAWRRWPSLFWFLLILTIKDAIRIANVLTLKNPWTDFYVYWVASLIAEMFEVWIIVQIAHAMMGISIWARRILTRGIVLIAVISMTTSIMLTMRGHQLSYQSLLCAVDRLSNAVALAWAALLIVVCGTADQVSEWTAGVRGVALGITLELTADSYIGWLRISNGHIASLDFFKSVLFLVSLLIWGISLGPKKKIKGAPRMPIGRIMRALHRYSEIRVSR